VQPGEGAFDDPAGAAESGAVSGVAACDLGCDPEPSELAAVLVVVVAAVGADTLGPTPRPADVATHRRHPLDKRNQLCYVVAVAGRDRPGERDPARVDQEVVLGTVSAPVNRARARLGAPFFACT